MSPNDDDKSGNGRVIDDGDVVDTDKTLKRKIIELTESEDPNKANKIRFAKKQEKKQTDDSDDN